MTKTRATPYDSPISIPRMPGWTLQGQAETMEDMGFLSGAALACLDVVTRSEGLPLALWRERLALQAAAASAGFSGRREDEAALRDAVHLTRPGDQPGPAGAIYRHWQMAVARPLSVAALGRALPDVAPAQIAQSLDAGRGNAVARAAATLEAALADAPRAEVAALIMADAALARAMGWDHLVPLLAAGLKQRDLRKTGDDLRLACHRAVVATARTAMPLAADLTRRAARLQVVAPKLRAKGADQAVARFLSQDALAPTALDFMSDRAARRLCDRLVALGAVRELTGRDTFRLYGV